MTDSEDSENDTTEDKQHMSTPRPSINGIQLPRSPFWKSLEKAMKLDNPNEGQKLLTQCIIEQEYFVTDNGRAGMFCIKDVGPPVESNGETYERYCFSCGTFVPLRLWMEHVKCPYHQIKFKTHLTLLGFCWYKVPHKEVHNPSECDECVRRMGINKHYSDKLENILEYKQADDEEYMEMMETVSKIEKLNKKYECDLCNIKCHTEEYYQNHINGKKHKHNLEKSKSKKPNNPPTNPNSQKKTKTINRQ